MSKSEHSRGPFVIGQYQHLDWLFVEQPSTGDTIAKVYKCTVEGSGDANARLIAAAPDLLDACEEALAHLKDPERIHPLIVPLILQKIHAAIHKAKGDST